MAQILGITLVRNEDRFLESALEATRGFCDRYLLFDHQSTDQSRRILDQFATSGPAAKVETITHPSISHDALRPLAGDPLWVFGIDGDEVYDRERLLELRPRLLAGEFNDSWMIVGNCLHADRLTEDQASGFLAPPSRSVTKLYNFAAIDAWPGKSMERLHGGTPVFRPGYDAQKKHNLADSWDASIFRCLHLCFLARSRFDSKKSGPRKNIDELYNRVLPAPLARLLARFLPGKSWKDDRYRRGSRVAVSIKPFFSNVP